MSPGYVVDPDIIMFVPSFDRTRDRIATVIACRHPYDNPCNSTRSRRAHHGRRGITRSFVSCRAGFICIRVFGGGFYDHVLGFDRRFPVDLRLREHDPFPGVYCPEPVSRQCCDASVRKLDRRPFFIYSDRPFDNGRGRGHYPRGIERPVPGYEGNYRPVGLDSEMYNSLIDVYVQIAAAVGHLENGAFLRNEGRT